MDIFSEEPVCRGGVEKKQGTDITRYVRDASGNVMAVYQNNLLTERPIYGSSRLGQMDSASAPGYRRVGLKRYELSNHLGNVLAVVSDRINMDSQNTWAEVISRTDYYPFGLEMTGRTESAGYRYGFNGKEKDNPGMGGGGSTYDYGFRIYNPSIGKFLSVDPLTGKYPMLTPYQFASNTPIQAIDLDGLEAMRYPGVGTTTEMLSKPTEQEVKEVYQAYRGIAFGVYDFFNGFRPQASMKTVEPNYITVYSEAKEAYRGINNTIENGTIEDKFRLGTIAALSIYGGFKKEGVGKVSWLDDAGNIKWPTNHGFAGTPGNFTLKPGARIDRYGYEGGSFVSPVGVPYKARSLAPGTEFKPHNVYEVVKPIDAIGGKVAPWFDEAGGGFQYKLNQPINKLLEGGYIKKVE